MAGLAIVVFSDLVEASHTGRPRPVCTVRRELGARRRAGRYNNPGTSHREHDLRPTGPKMCRGRGGGDLGRNRTFVPSPDGLFCQAVAAAEGRSMRTTRASSITARSSLPNLRFRLRRVRPGSTSVLLALTAGALPGCAGAHASGRTTATVAVTQASALAFARTVNLRASDQPEMEALGPERPAPSLEASNPAFARCDGEISPDRIVANIRSTLLSTAGERQRRIMLSRVTVLPSEALARRNLAAFSDPRGLRCARRSGTSISALSIPLPGGGHATGQRIVAPSAGPTHELGYHDIAGFVYGPTEIVLTAAGFSHPVATQTEQRLLGVLLRRAAEARGKL